MQNKQMNLDFIRFLMAFLVIAIHTSPFIGINEDFDFFFTRIFSRIAVPMFLMISGYYLLNQNKARLKAYTWKIIKVYIFCMILYLPLNIYMGELQELHLIDLMKAIAFNGTLYHLWYFPALIIGLWITYVLLMKLGMKKILVISIVLYVIGLLGDSYYGLIEGVFPLNEIFDSLFQIFDYTRNGFFFVPIFLCLGQLIRRKRIIKSSCIIGTFITFSAMCLEGMLLHHFQLQRHDSMYIFLPVLMYYLFSYLVSINKTSNKRLRRISGSIYIFHPWFIVILRFVSKLFKVEGLLVENHLCFYFLVSLITMGFAIGLDVLKEKC